VISNERHLTFATLAVN